MDTRGKGRASLPHLLLLLSLLALGAAVCRPTPAGAALVEGDRASAFSLADIYDKPVEIAPLLGKQVIVLKFGSIYCSSCVKSLADFSQLQEQFPVNQLLVVEVNLDIYGVLRAKRFYRGYQGKLNFPVVIDTNMNLARNYAIATLPSIVIIGKDGKVARVVVGYSEDELKPLLDTIARLVRAKPGEEAAALGPRIERKFQVLFPTNFTKTQQDSLWVVGSTPSPGIKLGLTLNGGSRQEITAGKEFFYFRTPISMGSNFLEVTLVEEGKARVNQAVVLFRDPKMGPGFQVPFPNYQFHLKENEEKCTACHELTAAEGGGQNLMMATEGCLKCHKELSRKSFVHGPIMVGGCSPCHDFGSLPARYQLFTAGADLCYSCHEEKRKEFSKDYLHGPLAAGFCTICHSPHTSNQKYQLRIPEGQLCISCHQQMKPLAFEKSVHKPFEDGRCSGCHNPHSSDNPQYFLVGVGDALCHVCHTEEAMKGHQHPIGTVPTYTFPEMKLDEERGTTFCSSCHLPHASQNPRLMPKEGCPSCHS